MRQHRGMSETLRIIKRLGVGAISTASSTMALGKVLVSSLGDIQAVSASAGTFAGLVLFLNSVPMWFVVASFLLSTGYLIWSSIQDDRARWKAMNDYKSVNERAWSFEPQFLDQCERLQAQHNEAMAQNASIKEELVGLRGELAGVKENLRESMLEEVKEAALQRTQQMLFSAQDKIDQKVQLAVHPTVSALTERMRIIDKHHTDFTRRLSQIEELLRQLPQGTGSETQP